MATQFHGNDHFDYAIVGGGCIGASTALALQREWPDARIVWFEGTDTHTASKDINKIIRTPYPDEDYIAFAEKAMKMWETEAPYRNFYHQTGWVQVISKGSYRSTKKSPKDKKISIDEMLHMVGSRDKPVLDAGEELWLNEDIGYVDSALALEAVAEEASKLGVVREKIDITRLIVNEEGICKGVEAVGDSIVADKTIVAAGPWTPGLLEASGIKLPNPFFTVAGVVVATMPLDRTEFDKFESMPILVSETGEVMPSRLHRVLKVTTTRTFSIENLVELKTNSGAFGVEPNRAVLKKMLPQFADRQLEPWVCFDLMTPRQHPIVDGVPSTRQLYVASGGSYHSFKFLPIFGEMVVRRLHGQSGSDTLEDRLLNRWVWDRLKETVAVHKSVVPRTS